MIALKDYRTKIKGMPDLLPYGALIAPDTVLCKNGALFGGFEFRGPDPASASSYDLDFLCHHVAQILPALGSGWMVHAQSLRKPESAYFEESVRLFSHPLLQLLDDERRELFSRNECYSTVSYLFFTYLPPFGHDKLNKHLVQGQVEQSSLEKSLALFQEMLLNVQSLLSAVVLVDRLGEYSFAGEKYSNLLSALQECIGCESQPMRLPPVPMYLDALFGQDLVGGFVPKLGDNFLGCISIDGLPQESYPAMFSALDSLPLSFRFSTRFICLDQLEAQKEIDTYRKTWQQKVFRFVDKFFNVGGRVNRDAARMVEDAEEALAEVQSGEVGAGFLTSTIILWDKDQALLENACRELRKHIMTMGFGCRVEQVNALEAWLGSLPGNSFANVRRPMVNSLNLAHLMPLTAPWSGDSTCPNPLYPPSSPALMRCVTDGSTPFWFNCNVSDLGHMLIFGPTGAGKSTLLATLIAQFFAYREAQVFAFDMGNSLKALCLLSGGKHFDIGKDLAFAPLAHIDTESERIWAADYIGKLVAFQGIQVMPSHKNAIHTALSTLAAMPSNLRSLSDFRNLLMDNELKEALQHYTKEGSMGRLLDAAEDNFGMGCKFMVFEIESLMNMGETNVVPVLLYLFHRLEGVMTGRPTALVLDEAWRMLGHPVFRDEIREWLKTMRKKVCGVWMATQSLSDGINSGIFDVLLESCQTKIYLPNREAKKPEIAKIYTQAGLSDHLIGLLSQGSPKRDYLVTQPQGQRFMQLALSARALSVLGASDPYSIAHVDDLVAEHDAEAWRFWLEEKGFKAS